MIPIAGSAYTYSYATMGEFIAWIIGWDLVLEYALGAATVSIGWSQYFNEFLHTFFNVHIPYAWSHSFMETSNTTAGMYVSELGTRGIVNLPAILILFLLTLLLIRGTAESATGPFYCPGDERVYIDLGFFDELKSRFGAPGEFAQAYVLTHELGHHVQKLLGTEQMVRRRQRANPSSANPLSVRLELQADCYAGVWGHYAGGMNQLDAGDIAEALNAATAIGDDRLQKQTQGRVAPESFTHGSSEQRVRWFKRGIDSGNPKDCDTFGAGSL